MAHRNQGFSLVELSIVLVILGLLTGGILTGQSLIRASELRAVTSEYQRYVAASQTFRDKYFAIPGDMRNATSFWGDDNTNCPDAAIANGVPGTCNGDADGFLEGGTGGSVTGEWFQFWKQLALAGLIEGTYSGLAGSVHAWDSIIGTNVPRSKLTNAGWTAGNWYGSAQRYVGDAANFAGDYGNLLIFGATNAGTWTSGFALKAEEAWNIDTKLDDGQPAVGKVIATTWGGCTTATGNTDTAAAYRLNTSTTVCAMLFARSF